MLTVAVFSLQVSFTDLDSDLLADNDVPDEEVIDSLNFAENSDSESDESDTVSTTNCMFKICI